MTRLHASASSDRRLRVRRQVPALLLVASLLPALGFGQSSRPPGADERRVGDGTDALHQAALLVQEGRLDDAERQARVALAAPGTSAAACSVLGTIRFQQNRLQESAGFLERAIRLEPGLLGAHLTLAQIYLLQGRREAALDLYRRALELDPSNPGARLALARDATERGQHQQSLALARPALAAFRGTPDGLFVLATNYLKTGDRAALAGLAGDWLRLGDVPEPWSIRFARVLASGGAAADAVGILEHLRATTAPSFELALNLGGVHLLNNDPARALEAYDVAIGLKPDAVPVLQQAAGIAEGEGQLERALSYWVRARKSAPDDPEILLGFGRVCLRMDLLDDAEPALERAVGLKPGVPAYAYTLAAAKVGKRQFEAAQRLLEELVAARPEDPQLQYALGSVLYIRGHLSDAAAHLRTSIGLAPAQLASRYYLALVTRDQGQDAEAARMLEALVAQYPEHAASCEALGGLLVAEQRYDEAERLLRKAARLNPSSVKATYQLGLLLARTGRKDEAERQLALARDLRAREEATSRLQLRLLDPESVADVDRIRDRER